MVSTIGKHCVLELHDCPFHLLNDQAYVREAVTEASKQGMSTLLDIISTQFEPQGVTALGLLAESHISVHTWPEHGYGAVDIFTCGEHADPRRACHFMIERFQAGDYSLRILPRGGTVDMGEMIESGADDSTSATRTSATPQQDHYQHEQEAAPCSPPPPQNNQAREHDSKQASGSRNTSARQTCTTMA